MSGKRASLWFRLGDAPQARGGWGRGLVIAHDASGGHASAVVRLAPVLGRVVGRGYLIGFGVEPDGPAVLPRARLTILVRRLPAHLTGERGLPAARIPRRTGGEDSMAGETRDGEARAAREAKLDEVREQLTAQVEKLVTGEGWKQALTFAAKLRSRSVNNSWLIFAQHQAAWEAGKVPDPMPTYVAGFRQWEQLGRHVEKGQKGYAILAPVTGKFASKNPSDPMSWRKLAPKEAPKPGEVVRSRMIGAKVAYVFDISQTSGPDVPLPPSPQLLEGEAPAGLRDGLIRQVAEAGFQFLPVPHEGMIHGANGSTNFDTRQVAVRTNMDDAAQVKTLVHELAHVKMHGPDQEEARQHRGIGEVEAESVALMVGAAHGMDTTAFTIPYVSGWAMAADGKNPIQVVQATAERVRKVAVEILDRLDTEQLGDGTPPGLTREGPEVSAAKQVERKPSASSSARKPAAARSARSSSLVRGL